MPDSAAETLEAMKQSDIATMGQAFADIETVRGAGYTVEVTGSWMDKKTNRQVMPRVVVKTDPSKPKVKGVYSRLVDDSSMGCWSLEHVIRVLTREQAQEPQKHRYRQPQIRLTDRQYHEAERYAEAVGEISKHYPKSMDLTGRSNMVVAIGEQGVRAQYGLGYEMDWKGLGVGDGGCDLILDGRVVDVKATDRNPSNLLICNDYWTGLGSDVLVHVIVENRMVTFVGWVWVEDFKAESMVGSDLPHMKLTPNCRAMFTTDLESMEGFRDALRDGYQGRDGGDRRRGHGPDNKRSKAIQQPKEDDGSTLFV